MNRAAVDRTLRTVRSIGTWYVAEQTLTHLETIRRHELESVVRLLPPAGEILEIGAGSGWQASALAERGYTVHAVDIASSYYRVARVWPVMEYDGRRIPFDADRFDVVFSSNVLEHIPHLEEFQAELHRVLKPGGRAIHVLPSSSWRFWTNITHLVKCWTLPKTHGEHARNPIAEMICFSRRWWTERFRENGWVVAAVSSNRLFYTGHSIMDDRLSIAVRERLSRLLGGSCNIFVLRKSGRLR
jgi:SAM-dependent methyltransferase